MIQRLAGVRVLQAPAAIRAALAEDEIDRFGHPCFGHCADASEIVQPAQDVVVMAGGEREAGPGRVDLNARATYG